MANIPVGLDDVRIRLLELRDELSTGREKEVMNMALVKLEGMTPMDVSPVVHGRWKRVVVEARHDITCDECSVCGFKYGGLGIEFFRYCPGCGAKMDGGTST